MTASFEAWSLEGSFGLDHLQRVERPAAEPGPGQVALEMGAASLNYRDLLMVRGHYNPRQPLPLIPCSDGVGTVVAVGEGVTRVAEGDRVLPTFAQGWLAGPPSREDTRTTLGGPLDGALTRRMMVSASGVVRAPGHLTDAEAATLPCAGVTAWHALEAGGIRAGDTVLTLGTGGVSIFALQLGRLLGARVLVTSSSDDKLERARQLGADGTVNYRQVPGWGDRVLELTDGRGVDLVLELGGAGTLEQSLKAVRPGGTIALIGVLSGVSSNLNILPILMRSIRVQGILVGSRHHLETLARAVAQHELRPVVDRTFSFAEAREAFEHMASGKHFGKIAVAVD